MNDRIHIVRESIVKLTQMLSGHSVRVTQQGVSAYVKSDSNGKPYLVNLPYIPDNATNELIDAIQGFLDHEVAHILFTDFSVAAKADKKTFGMLNLLEDIRIEACMANRFRGSALNLTNTGKFFLDKYIEPKLREAVEAGDNDRAAAVLTTAMMRSLGGQSIFTEYLKDKMHIIQDVYDKVKDLAPKIESTKSTEDCLKLAEVVLKRLKEDEPSAPPMPTPSPSKSKSSSSPSKSSPDTPEEDPSEEDPSEEESGASVSGEQEDSEGENEGEGEDSDESGSEEGEDGEGSAKSPENDLEITKDSEEEGIDDLLEDDGKPSKGGGVTDIAKSASGTRKEIEKELQNGYDDAVSSIITNSAATVASESDYLIFSKDEDLIEPMKIGREFSQDMLTQLQESVDHMVAPLQKDLERAISARSLSVWSAGHRSGKLHASSIARLATGDDRVFRRKHESTSKDVAVSLVVDASGSMSGEKIGVASQSAYALASVLERIGIKCEVICFTTGTTVDTSKMTEETKKIGRRYSRTESLYMPILKGYDERMSTPVRNRFGWLPHSSILRNNVDGECVEIAARRLLQRRETGKILMVLSDGAPHGMGNTRDLAPHLKKVVKDITRAGVNVIGIGICSDDVKQFYPKSLVIKSVDELPKVVMTELRSLIIK